MIGTDIIEVSRIQKLIKEKGYKFLNKIYTQNEIDYCESKGPNKYQHYAGRFAAKEAIYKVMSYIVEYDIILKNILFKKCEIINNTNGSPKVNLPLAFEKRNISINVSISHIKKYATATAILINPQTIIYDKKNNHK